MRVRPTRVRRLRTRKAIRQAAVVTAILSVGATHLAIQKNVTLVVDGRPQSVRTLSASVGELLSVTGIALEHKDQVEPPPSTPLSDGMTVVVDTQPLTAAITSAHIGVGVWVVEGASERSARLTAGGAETPFSAEGLVGTSPVVHARVVVEGKEHDVLTNAGTVGALLSAMGVRPDPNDRVLPPPRTPLHDGRLVTVSAIEMRTHRVVETIPVDTMTTYTSALAPGETRIVSNGRPGSLLEVYREQVVNGAVVEQTLVRRQVLAEAEPRRRLVGRASPDLHGTQTGEASWYSFAPGDGLTAAHPWLPYGTVVTVTNLANGRSIRVVINDRGPFSGRIIDLSDEAFSALAALGTGIIDVRLTW